MNCGHASRRCVNPYETIRKYECLDCGGVMMCVCDEEYARRFLSHQLSYGTDLETKNRLPVTLGFQAAICNVCRGLRAEPSPKAAMRGAMSNVRRYYWREISMTANRRFAEWAEQKGFTYTEAQRAHRDVRDQIRESVVDEIKKLHETAPKYTYERASTADVLRENNVEVLDLHATFVKVASGRSIVLDGADRVSVEEFVSRHYMALGYKVALMESRPFHALFATFMWLVIEDFTDPRTRVVGFGARPGSAVDVDRGMTNAILPDDFGSRGYGERRRDAIDEHINDIPDEANAWQWLFDYSFSNSHRLREYLHAYEEEVVQRARLIATVVPPAALRRILKYLTSSYWERYLGWPDLLVYRNSSDFFFVEVKGSGAHLSDPQKTWISGNTVHLRLPFRLAKIHRDHVVES